MARAPPFRFLESLSFAYHIFIHKNTEELGEGPVGLGTGSVRPGPHSGQSAGAACRVPARVSVCTRVWAGTRAPRCRGSSGGGSEACAARAGERAGKRVPVRVPGPQARGEQSSRCLVRGAYARPSGRPGLVTVSGPSGSCFPP